MADTRAGAFMVWCPFPDEASAKAASDLLLEAQLIACANILGGIESRFRYEGAIQSESEVAVVFKSTLATAEHFVERLAEIHPYDTPAILGWDCEFTPPSTMDWLGQATRRDT